MLVAICPSQRVLAVARPRGYLLPGTCPGNVEPLLKHIAAVAGDTVEVSDRGVAVDGQSLPNSGRLARDCEARPLPRIAAGRYAIAKGEVWLYAPVGHSWDSRYFGPEPAANVVGFATPVLIFGEGSPC
jgi:conjugative transfer signal peptidase TraF